MKIYLVGGAIRNQLLNLPIKDRDWMIVGATPEQLLAQGFLQVGQDFPVFLHPKTKEEYALARTERKSGQGYKGFAFDFNPNITLEEDLIRRDLTINAIAQDEAGQIHDPFNGILDLKNRALRHISDAFREDPLRVLRVARFAAEFYELGFSIAPETLELMQRISQSNELQALTIERIWIETEKALHTQHPEVYFLTLKQCGALKILFPEIDSLYSIQAPVLHCNLAELTLNGLQKISSQTTDLTLRFSALTQHIGLNHANNDQLSNRVLNTFLNRLKVPNDYKKKATRYHLLFWFLFLESDLSSKQALDLLYQLNIWKESNNLEEFAKILLAFTPTNNIQTMQSRINNLFSAFDVTQKIDAQQMIQQGFKGKAISEQLFIARLNQLNVEK